MTFKIESNIPIPPKMATAFTPFTTAVRELEVGQSFLVKDADSNKTAGKLGSISKTIGRKFTTRKLGADLRIWRVE